MYLVVMVAATLRQLTLLLLHGCCCCAGLLYFAGSDAQGLRPTEQLAQVNTEADFEAIK